MNRHLAVLQTAELFSLSLGVRRIAHFLSSPATFLPNTPHSRKRSPTPMWGIPDATRKVQFAMQKRPFYEPSHSKFPGSFIPLTENNTIDSTSSPLTSDDFESFFGQCLLRLYLN
jgi:hypothetical protein